MPTIPARSPSRGWRIRGLPGFRGRLAGRGTAPRTHGQGSAPVLGPTLGVQALRSTGAHLRVGPGELDFDDVLVRLSTAGVQLMLVGPHRAGRLLPLPVDGESAPPRSPAWPAPATSHPVGPDENDGSGFIWTFSTPTEREGCQRAVRVTPPDYLRAVPTDQQVPPRQLLCAAIPPAWSSLLFSTSGLRGLRPLRHLPRVATSRYP